MKYNSVDRKNIQLWRFLHRRYQKIFFALLVENSVVELVENKEEEEEVIKEASH
jgi:hypothetical protein